MNPETGNTSPNRWLVLARVVLFLLSCAVVLAATAPLSAGLRGNWQELSIGTIASFGAFALTLLFVRWEKIRMEDVGAAVGRRSLARLTLGPSRNTFPIRERVPGHGKGVGRRRRRRHPYIGRKCAPARRTQRRVCRRRQRDDRTSLHFGLRRHPSRPDDA